MLNNYKEMITKRRKAIMKTYKLSLAAQDDHKDTQNKSTKMNNNDKEMQNNLKET